MEDFLIPANRSPVWQKAARNALLSLGVVHILAAVIMFFAANWQEMGRILRLSLPIVGFIAACGGVFVVKSRRLHAILGCAAVIFIGISLAVFGQEYQTGAEAWQFFTAWAGFGLVLLFAVPSASLVAVWMVVAHLAMFAFINQVLRIDAEWPPLQQAFVVGVLDAVVLSAAFRVNAPRWLRLGITAIMLGVLLVGSVSTMFDKDWGMIGAGFGLMAAMCVGLSSLYRCIRYDFAGLALVTLAACLYLYGVAFKIILPDVWWDQTWLMMLLLAAMLLGITLCGGAWLRFNQKIQKAGQHVG